MLALRRGAVGTRNALTKNPNWAKLWCDSEEGPTEQRGGPCRAARRLRSSHCGAPWDNASGVG